MNDVAVSDLPSHTTHNKLEALLPASRLLTPSIELDALLRVIVTTVTESLSANASSLPLVDPVTHELIVTVATGPVSTSLKEVPLKEEKPLFEVSLDERYRTLIVVSQAMRHVVEMVEKAAKIHDRLWSRGRVWDMARLGGPRLGG